MDQDKLASIQKACDLTEKIFQKTIDNFSKFSTEKQVASFIKKEFRAAGVGPSFPPIVGSGAGGSEPHHKPSLPLSRGFCVIDLGLKVNSYCSDFTRTVFLGKPSEKDLFLYNLVVKAQKEGINQVRAGVEAIVPYNASRQVLGEYADKFNHGLGHGVGKHIHIKPYMKKVSKDALKENDIVTVEPGIYFKGEFGIRVEDVFLVTKNGCEPITHYTTKLIEIPFNKT